jgi:hypothetical protein
VKERCIACNGSGHYDHDGAPKCASCNGTGYEVPRGYTHTEIEVTETTDSVTTLWALLGDHAGSADDFLIEMYVFELVAETLTDGSVKRSIRIRPVV